MNLVWEGVKVFFALTLIGFLCVVFAGAVWAVFEIGKKYPWSVVAAAPMVAAYAWAIWGTWPGMWWRLAFAFAVQTGTIVIANLITR